MLRTLPDASIDSIVTSPPYWGLRSYHAGPNEIGKQQTPDAYVAALVAVFKEAARVLSPRGAMWLNLGDSYVNAKGQAGGSDPKNPARRHGLRPQDVAVAGLKRKDLVGIPWMVAFALRADGWWLRRDQIWAKPNPMPDSVNDRTTSSHEYIFLLTRAMRYYFNGVPIREPYSAATLKEFSTPYRGTSRKAYEANGVQNPSDLKRRMVDKQRGHTRKHAGFNARWDSISKEEQQRNGANSRSVWVIATEGSRLEHYAVMPKKLARKLVLSICPPGGTVLDPFAGAGTTGVVALEEGRSFVGIELSEQYADIARCRLADTAPLLAYEIHAPVNALPTPAAEAFVCGGKARA